jgi:hypothetical protein
MGFTPVEGLVMATRPGGVDPGMLLWLVTEGGIAAEELADALVATVARGRPEPRLSPTHAASLVVAATPRIRPLPTWRPIVARTAAAAAAAILAGGWTFQSDDPFPLVARTFDLDPVTHVSTTRQAVALVVRGDPTGVRAAAEELAAHGARASFAFASRPTKGTLALLATDRDQPIPELGPGGRTRWLDTRDRLQDEARALGLRQLRFYLAPAAGFDLGQYVFGLAIDASPIAGAVSVGSAGPAGQLRVRAGDVVVVTLGSPPSAGRAVAAVLASLRARGLSAVSLGDLVAAAAERVKAAPPTVTSASEPSSSARPAGVELQLSARITGAKSTGATVWTANTTGATRAAGAT